jgi:hypothetical protein
MWALYRAGLGQPNCECRPSSELTVDGDVTLVRFDEPLGDIQPEAKARLTQPRALGLIETVEEARQLLWSDARALVRHRDGAAVCSRADGYGDGRAGRRIFGGVLDQVREDLLDPRRVGPHGAHAGVDVDGERVCRQGGTKALQESRHRLAELDRLRLKRQTGSLDDRRVEQIPNQLCKVLAAAL